MFRKKESGPLQLLQKDALALKKKTDKVISECNALVKKPPKDKKKLDAGYEKCTGVLTELETMLKRANELKPEDEPTPVDKYDAKKTEEIKQLESYKERVKTVAASLAPLTTAPAQANTESVSKAKSVEDAVSENEDEDEEDDGEEEEEAEEGEEEDDDDASEADDAEEEGEQDDEEEEDEDEDEEEEEEEKDKKRVTKSSTHPVAQKMKANLKYVAGEDFTAQQDGDLSFVKGEILTVVKTRDDGWVVAKNAKGQQGMAPGNYLEEIAQSHKTKNKPEAEDEEETEEEEEEEEEEEGDEEANSEEEEEDDEAEIEEAECPSPTTPRSGKQLWKVARKDLHQTSVTDVLHALGALPTGFRESTLAQTKLKDEFSYKRFLMPKLSNSSLAYQDLVFNDSIDRIRGNAVTILRVVTVVSCEQIPALPEGTEVLSRHVRACLFDGEKILSNIIVFRASQVDKEQKTWTFVSKQESKCAELAEFAVRSNLPSTNLGILFELCVSVRRVNTTHEGELSCGWVFQKLYDPKNAIISNKTYEEPVHGGTPYEKGIEVDANIGRTKTSALKSLMASNRQPRLTFRLAAPTKEQKEYLDTLPDVIVCNTAYIQFMSFYRQLLAEKLLQSAADIQSTEPIHCPVLSSLPDILEQPDLMDILRSAWAEKLRIAKRADKKDKSLFVRVFMDSVYPLYSVADVSSSDSQGRAAELQRLVQLGRDRGSLASCLLAADVRHRPFDVSELAFSLVRQTPAVLAR